MLPSSPPLPKELPSRHQLLHRPSARQPLPVHPALLVSLPIGLSYVVRADQREAPAMLCQLVFAHRAFGRREIGPAGHAPARIAYSPFVLPASGSQRSSLLGRELTPWRGLLIGSFAFLSAAQRLRVAFPILFRTAALIFRRLRGGLGDSCAPGSWADAH